MLFINLLTDSLPAIALGLEPHTDDVMKEHPRAATSSILTASFMKKIGLDGLVIGTATVCSYLTGLQQGNALLASTCAFGTLCLARLFHGFNCKSEKSFGNKFLYVISANNLFRFKSILFKRLSYIKNSFNIFFIRR